MNEDQQLESGKEDNKTFRLRSTSRITASAQPIILRETAQVRVRFEPVLVDNPNEHKKCISGKLIYEKKRKAEGEFPTDKLTPQKIRTGEYMEITLHTDETFDLFFGLQSLYELYRCIGKTPSGSTTYTQVDSGVERTLTFLKSDPKLAEILAKAENIEVFVRLLKALTQAESVESLTHSLEELKQANVSVLTNSLNIARLKRFIRLLEDNLENENEEFWQQIFASNQWILSQIFASPCTIFEEKAYVGGKKISNTGGSICDFIYKNRLTDNITLVEIKTPCTKLFGSIYRGTYSFSADMSGSINQVLNYKDTLTKEYYQNVHGSDETFQVFNPKCLVVIGKVTDFKDKQIAAFENYRNSLSNISIVTFDELLQRIKDILSIFTTKTDQHD